MKNIARVVLSIACIIALCTLLIACSDSKTPDDQPDQEASGAQSSPADDEPELVEEPQAPSYPSSSKTRPLKRPSESSLGKRKARYSAQIWQE